MQRPRQITLSAATALSANNIATSQTPGGAGAVTLNGSTVTAGVATLDVARRVGITSAGNDSARTFVITGTDRYGNVITESLAGANATLATSKKDYKTVTSITVDAGTAGAITIGTTGVISSEWVPLDRIGTQDYGLGVRQTGTTAWAVEVTYQDPQQHTDINQVTDFYLTPWASANFTGKSASTAGLLERGITAFRLTTASYTAGAILVADLVPDFGSGV